jgi:hypothetical protein
MAQIAGEGGCLPPGESVEQTSASEATLRVDFLGLEIEPDFLLTGDIVTRATGGDGDTIQTEMVSMNLTGTHPDLGEIVLRLNPQRPTVGRGTNCREVELPDGGTELIFDVFFDVFFIVTVEGGEVRLPQLSNAQALRMQSGEPIPLLHRRPFALDQVRGQVALNDANGRAVGFVSSTKHSVSPPKSFKRGDANCDGCVDEDDAIFINNFLFIAGSPEPCCHDAADANDDGAITTADSIFILAYVSQNGPPPPAPGPVDCGPDPTPDALPEGVYDPDACERQCQDPGVCDCYPPAGDDIMQSTLLHDIDIPGIGLCRANLSGPVTVHRSDPFVDPATGLCCINTEITALRLEGSDPVCGRICITLNPCKRSVGQICEEVSGTCFPANSWFNVYMKVELKDLGFCLYACEPAMMHCMIDRLPPFRCLYNLDDDDDDVVPLYRAPCMDECDPAADPCAQDPLPEPAAFIIKAVHQPLPPDECDCFPPAGDDSMNTTLFHAIEIPGLDLTCSQFTGPIVVERRDPFLGPDGRCYILTEVVRLEMEGECSDGSTAKVTLCPDMPSRGFICQIDDDGCFPALSCFQIFFQIEITAPDGVVRIFKNCDPAIMCCTIDALPPIGCRYGLEPQLPDGLPGDVLHWMRTEAGLAVNIPGGGAGNLPIDLYAHVPGAPHPCRLNPRPRPVGFLTSATHVVDEPNDRCCPEYGPGRDTMQTTLLQDILIPGLDITCRASLRGPMTVERGVPYQDPLTGLCCVETRVVSLDLNGVDPECGRICITLDPRRDSRGRICEKEPGTCFPANSCFDIWVRIELKDLGLVFVVCRPARMCCMIDALPPIGCTYNLDLGSDPNNPDLLSLFEEVPGVDVCGLDPRPEPVAFINRAVHRPDPPCECFPDAGEDIMQTELSQRIRLFGLGPNGGDLICDADMRGPTRVSRSDPYIDPTTGLCCIDTKIEEMRLEGNDPICGPVIVTLCPDNESRGQICAKSREECFPANSFFRLYVRIEIPNLNLVLKNCAPVLLECMIDRIPPINCFYQLRLSAVPLYLEGQCEQLPNADINPVGQIEAARHVPREPCECPEYGPGIDTIDSTLSHRIDIPGVGICDTPLRGRVVIERGEPYVNADGLCCVSTRIVELNAEGVDPLCGPIRISLCDEKPSRGTICQKPDNPDGQCFPANSCFDVYVKIEILDLGLVLKNCDPATMCCMINQLPPWGCNYQFDLPRGLELFREGECDDPDARPVAHIVVATHTPTPCPPIRVVCDPIANSNQVVVAWTVDDDCQACERILVTRTNPDGTTTTFPLPAGATSFTDNLPLDELCEDPAVGVVQVRYCVQCVISGVPSPITAESCCDVEIVCPTDCDLEQVVCTPLPDGTGLIRWIAPEECCDRFIISRRNSDGTVTQIGTAPGDVREFLVELCVPGAYCVQCVRVVAGAVVVGPLHCCELSCLSVICDITGVNCDPVGDDIVVIVWDPPDCECDEIIVTCTDEAGNVTTVPVPAGANSVRHQLNLDELCRNDANGDGLVTVRYCVQCRVRDDISQITDDSCCTISVRCPCVVGNVVCRPHPNVANAGVVTWTLPPNCECDRFRVVCTINGVEIASDLLPGSATSFEFDIPDLREFCEGDRDGVVEIECCVQCVVGQRVSAPECCTLQVECPPTVCDPQDVLCRFDDGLLVVTWTPSPLCECDEFVITCFLPDGTTVEDTVPGNVPNARFPISEDRLRQLCDGDADGVINIRCCVVCRTGDDESKAVCCDVDIACPPDPCDAQNVTCRFDERDLVATVVWELSDDPRCHCDVIIVTCISEDETETRFVLPGGATSFQHQFTAAEIDRLCREDNDGQIDVRYCVTCVIGDPANPDDVRQSKPQCCDLTIPCPGCELEAVNCDVDTDADGNPVGLVVNWVTGNCECDEFIVRCFGPDGNVFFEETVLGGQNSLARVIPQALLDRLCEQSEDGVLRLRYCVQCVLRGEVGKALCCELEIPCPPRGGRVRPCDLNLDNLYDIGDAVTLFSILFLGAPLPCDSPDAFRVIGDANGDGNVDLSDGVYKLFNLFLGGPPPVLVQQGVRCVTLPDCPDVCEP